MNQESATLEKIFAWALLAGVGGAVKYISTVIRSSEVVTNRRFLFLLGANVFISSFCGLMGGLFVTTITTDPTWQYLASGLFGYLGTQGLDLVVLALKKKIGSPTAVPVSAAIPVPPALDPSTPPK